MVKARWWERRWWLWWCDRGLCAGWGESGGKWI